MEENHISFEDEVDRGKCAREINELFEKNNLNWRAYGNAIRKDIFILPKGKRDYDNLPAVTRMSLRIEEDEHNEKYISFGISGYFPVQIKYTKELYENKGYSYHRHKHHDKEVGRWWLTKPIGDLNQLAHELKDIESLLYKKFD